MLPPRCFGCFWLFFGCFWLFFGPSGLGSSSAAKSAAEAQDQSGLSNLSTRMAQRRLGDIAFTLQKYETAINTYDRNLDQSCWTSSPGNLVHSFGACFSSCAPRLTRRAPRLTRRGTDSTYVHLIMLQSDGMPNLGTSATTRSRRSSATTKPGKTTPARRRWRAFVWQLGHDFGPLCCDCGCAVTVL